MHDFAPGWSAGAVIADESVLEQPLMRRAAFFDAGTVLHQLDDAASLIGFVVEEQVFLQVNGFAAVTAEAQLAGLGKLLVRVAPKMACNWADQAGVVKGVVGGNFLFGRGCVHDHPFQAEWACSLS
ncbi:MAG: hypothetical protein KAX68_05555, partial [Giesbergeria sp.]|nr:hypothetical protein [Giesbergeria sp.]